MDPPAFRPDASMLQMQILLDHQQQLHLQHQGLKRGLDDDESDISSHDHGGMNKRRGSTGSLPPFKKRHVEVPQDEEDEPKATTASTGTGDLAARLEAFAEAQRRSKVSRELLAKATQELQKAKQVQQQQQLIRIMALQEATKRNSNAERRRSSLGPSCGSRTSSLALGGMDGFGTTAAQTGAAW